MINRCTCAHAQQDRLHGKGMRVFTPTRNGHRCTVCGKEIAGSGIVVKNKKKGK